MRKLLLALATIFFVACTNNGNKQVVEDLNLPEYKLLSTEEPRISSGGTISPTQNLVYNIAIDYPMSKDSLELLQDYFIKKGEYDFEGVNKIIVRVYLDGTFQSGTPYASLNYVAGIKDILLNENATALQELNEPEPVEIESKNADAIVGSYFCKRTHDTYVFKSNNTGYMNVQGAGPSEFTWKRSGKNVTIVYELSGEQKLTFNQKAKTITEESEWFGTLVFVKQ